LNESMLTQPDTSATSATAAIMRRTRSPVTLDGNNRLCAQ
jgi:hypothetical protein